MDVFKYNILSKKELNEIISHDSFKKYGAIKLNMYSLSLTWAVVTLWVGIVNHLTPDGVVGQSNKLLNGTLGMAFIHDLKSCMCCLVRTHVAKDPLDETVSDL